MTKGLETEIKGNMKKSRKKSDSRGNMIWGKKMTSARDIDLRAEGFTSREAASARTLGGDAALHS